MHKRAIILTVGAIIVVALTAFAPPALAWLQANHATPGAARGDFTLLDDPYPYPYPYPLFLPIVCNNTFPCTSLTSVTISGNENGEPGEYIFTTGIDPADATTPITYLWDNEDTASSSTRNLTVGIYTLVVTATNCGGSVTDEHGITITDSYPQP